MTDVAINNSTTPIPSNKCAKVVLTVKKYILILKVASVVAANGKVKLAKPALNFSFKHLGI